MITYLLNQEYAMTMLIKIGNSQGVRIPKAIIKQAHLENAPLEFEVTAQGLLLKPVQKNRVRDGQKHLKIWQLLAMMLY
jgi:antitoxin MazE